VGIALVLASVFVPTAFIPGITGRPLSAIRPDHRDFGDPLCLQCAHAQPGARCLLLRTKSVEGSPSTADLSGNFFFDAFNRYWNAIHGFVRWSHAVIRKGALVMVLLVLFGLGAFFFGNRLPSSFMSR